MARQSPMGRVVIEGKVNWVYRQWADCGASRDDGKHTWGSGLES